MAKPAQNSVAVIVVNFNAKQYLPRCLSAIAEQSLAPARVIVIDNGSTDGSISAAKQAYPDVEYIELGENTGFAAANNFAVRLADDVKWVALINPDAFVSPQWLESLLSVSAQNDALSFFSSALLCEAPDDQIDGTGDCYHASGLVWRRQHGVKTAAGNIPNSQHPVFSPCAAAAMYAREAFMEVGGFDEDFFCYIEDVDLVFRLRLLGYEGSYVDSAVARHVGSAITVKDSDFSVYHGHRNLVWAYVKNMPMPLLIKTLPQHLLLNIVSLIYYTIKGRPGVIFRSKWDALKGLRQQWQKRRHIQARRTQISANIEDHMTQGWLTPYRDRQG